MRSADPIDGRLDWDVDGKAVGTWFREGTNGYAGSEQMAQSVTGYAGHLALAYDSIDPKALIFSIGDYQGKPTQFAIKGNDPDWATVDQSSGVVKYELAKEQYSTATGKPWDFTYSPGVKLSAGSSQATVLLQLIEKQKMKVEVFPGKTPAQVSGFTGAALIYNRGQDAHMIDVSSTATHGS